MFTDAGDEDLVVLDSDLDRADVSLEKRTCRVGGQVGFGGIEEWLGSGEGITVIAALLFSISVRWTLSASNESRFDSLFDCLRGCPSSIGWFVSLVVNIVFSTGVLPSITALARSGNILWGW